MQGIPWTKVIASIFWSSYLVLELLGILAWSSTGGESTTDRPSSLLLPSLYGERTQKADLEKVENNFREPHKLPRHVLTRLNVNVGFPQKNFKQCKFAPSGRTDAMGWKGNRGGKHRVQWYTWKVIITITVCTLCPPYDLTRHFSLTHTHCLSLSLSLSNTNRAWRPTCYPFEPLSILK